MIIINHELPLKSHIQRFRVTKAFQWNTRSHVYTSIRRIRCKYSCKHIHLLKKKKKNQMQILLLFHCIRNGEELKYWMWSCFGSWHTSALIRQRTVWDFPHFLPHQKKKKIYCNKSLLQTIMDSPFTFQLPWRQVLVPVSVLVWFPPSFFLLVLDCIFVPLQSLIMHYCH